jgi:hypothetical protein
MTTQTLEIDVMPKVVELINQKNELNEKITAMQNKEAEISGEITELMLQYDIKEAYGESGLGYRVQAGPTRYEFGKMAYAYLGDKELLGHFQPDPKITKTKLDALLKEGTITYSDMAEIDKFMTTDQSPYTLRKVVDKTNPNVIA